MWLGIASFELFLVYVLCVLAALWCLIYGLFFFASKERAGDVKEHTDWEKEEAELQKELP
jgi:hypothetical protein